MGEIIMSKCKWCDSELRFKATGGKLADVFACGSSHIYSDENGGVGGWEDQWCQSAVCYGILEKRDMEDLKQFRIMFPIVPWDKGDITAFGCEKLGMDKVDVTELQTKSAHVLAAYEKKLSEHGRVEVTLYDNESAAVEVIYGDGYSSFVCLTPKKEDRLSIGELARLVGCVG